MDQGSSYEFRIKKPSKKRKLPEPGKREITVEQAMQLAMQRHKVALAYLKDH